MTGCISIWVKNLANVANVAGWVRRKGTTLGAVFLLVGRVYISLSLVFFFFLSLAFISSIELICVCECPSVRLSVLQMPPSDTHMKARPKHF